jgi:hypothetical protein
MKEIIYTREQVYKLVWSDPFTILAKKYNISDVGLRKACVRMNISIPEAGYWSKVRAGKSVVVKPFSMNDTGVQELTLYLRTSDQTELSPEVFLQKKIENDANIDLSIPERLNNPDPIVLIAQAAMREREQYARNGEFLYPRHIVFFVKTTLNTLERSLCLLDTFIKIMRKRGHDFKICNGSCYILINGLEEMKVSLKEASTIVKIKHEYSSWPTTEYHPNGILSLTFEHWGTTASIRDGKVPIENHLSKIIAKLEILAHKLKIERLENEERNRRYREQEQIKKEFAERKKLELESLKKVLKDSRRLNEVTALRHYIDQVEQKAISDKALTEEIIQWLDWIRKKADWLDPLTNGYDNWLDEIDPNSLLQQDSNDATHGIYSSSVNAENRNDWPLSKWYLKK